MKYTNYIMIGLLLGGISLTSCENEDWIEKEGTIQSASEDVPEGYAKVYFPCSNEMQTRVASGTVDNYVSYLDVYIYEKQDEDFLLIKDGNQSIVTPENASQETWPLAYSTTLKKDVTYKAVFLGNVNNALFSGTTVLSGVSEGANYEDARISTPAIGFSDKTMFFMANVEFTVQDGNNNVPVILKRIISGHSIANYGFNGASGDIISVCKGMLSEDQSLGGQIFGGETDSDKDKENKSLMWQQLHQRLMRDFIFPIAYVLKEQGTWTSGTELDTWWNTGSNVSDFWDIYEDTGFYSDDYSAEDMLNGLLQEGLPLWLSDTDKKSKVLSLVNDLYSNKDNCIDAILKAIKEQDLKQVISGVAEESGSYTLTQEAIAEHLATALGQSSLFPFKQGTDITITLNKVPKTVDFDLNIPTGGTEESSEQTVHVSSDGSLDFYFLGTTDESFGNFGFSSLTDATTSIAVSLPETFPGQPLNPNVRITYRVTPDSPLSWDGEVEESESTTVYISYNKIAEAITTSGITDLSKEDLTGEVNGSVRVENAPFRMGIKASYYINRQGETSFILTPQYGQEDTGVFLPNRQAFFTMPMPDFSNLTVDTKWEYESSVTQ